MNTENDKQGASPRRKALLRLRRLAFISVVTAIAGYLAVLAGAYLFQRKLTYFPTPIPAGESVLLATDRNTNEEWIDTADGFRLHVVYKPAADSRKTILYLHGNAHNLTDRLPLFRELAALGLGCLLIDYRGFGRSTGRPTEKGLYEDARASMAWLERKGVPASMVILFGESIGTGVAVETALHHKVAGMVLQSPYTSIPDVGGHHFRILPAGLLMHDRFDSLSKAASIRCPSLSIWADRDRIVPPRFSERLFAALPQPKRNIVLKGSEHFDIISLGRKQYLEAWTEFVALCGGDRPAAPVNGRG